MKAPVAISLGGLLAGSIAAAGPLSMEPRIGLATEYSSNPSLRPTDIQSENNGALLLDAPLRYDLDTLHFTLSPSARYSNSSGYASLASNYLRADSTAQFMSERGSLTLNGEFARDSSLYNGGESDRGVGVRRDTRAAGLDWQRTLSARAAVQLNLGWSRVSYDQRAVFTNLIDYKYVSMAPSLSYAITERDTVRLLSSAGRYNSLSGITSSKDYNVQLGLDREISELWSLSASAGYSQSRNRQKYFFGPFFLGEMETKQKGSVYAVHLQRRGESLFFSAGASRALRPSGFAFLSRQDSVDAVLTYQYSERWTFSASSSAHRALDPLGNFRVSDRRYLVGEISTDWHWTPDWMITLRATRVSQRLSESTYNADSNGVSLQVTRQFGRMDLN